MAARRGGARLRQHAPVASVEVLAGRAIGVVLADGSRIGAAHVVLAAGPWSATLAAGVGIDLPVRAQRAQILLVDPGRPPGPLPVFSDLVSLQYVRTEGGGQILLGDSDHSDPEWADPDAYRERVNDDELALAVPKFTHRFPGFDGASLASSYAGCYDVTPDYNPIISASPVDGRVAVHRLLGPRLQDLAVGRQAHGRPDHHAARAATPTSTRTTSAGSASPRRIHWSARTPTSAPARCADSAPCLERRPDRGHAAPPGPLTWGLE